MVQNTNTTEQDQSKNTEEGINIPGEQSPYEEKARSTGWRPKEEWNGDPDLWIDAKEFVLRQPLFDTISSLKSEIWHLKKDFNQFAEFHKKVADTEYQRAVEDLKEQRKVAAKEGDTEKVVEISDKLESIRLKEPPQATPGPVPEFSQWMSQNPWYGSDPELHASADSLGIGYKASNPNATPQQVLDHVSAKIKELYPQKFGSRRNGSASVEGTTNAPSRRSSSFGEADLNEVEKAAMNTFVKRKLMTKEQYITELAKAKGK